MFQHSEYCFANVVLLIVIWQTNSNVEILLTAQSPIVSIRQKHRKSRYIKKSTCNQIIIRCCNFNHSPVPIKNV